jgi:nicotinate-nucleotide pyrophosphorylase (carboxylating)
MNEYKSMIEKKIKEYLQEDLGFGDITSESLISPEQKAGARLYYKELGIVSGLTESSLVFELLGCEYSILAKEGSNTDAYTTLMEITGPARAILMGERLALNLVGRMAGIATHTSKVVEKGRKVNPKIRIAATRKTAPGLRIFDKRAVIHGGGDPHRFRLDDCVLIKDNHLELLPSITIALEKTREKVSFTKKIEVEVRSLEGAIEAARAGADIIMFDNMSPNKITENLSILKEKGFRDRVLFEASGGITIENVSEYAATGVDILSLGSLTHSVESLDVKLEIEMM